MAAELLGVMTLMFHADVWPIPISVSPTQADFLLADVECPINPETLSSFVVCNTVRNDFWVLPGAGGPYLNVKRCVKAHLKVSLFVFCEDTEEALFENGSRKRIREDNDTVCGVG